MRELTSIPNELVLTLGPAVADACVWLIERGFLDGSRVAIGLSHPGITPRKATLCNVISVGFLKSATPKGAVRIAVPLDYCERLFPDLFTDPAPTVPWPPSPAYHNGIALHFR